MSSRRDPLDVSGEPEMGSDAAIAEVSATVRGLLGRATRDEVATRHEIGRLLCAVRGERGRYGERAIERIAATLSVKVHALYECAAVAESWRAEEMQALLARTNRRGEPLTWSHWVLLTRVAAVIPRRHMLDRCLAEGWNVRDLKRVIAARRHASGVGKNDDVAEGQSVRVALSEGTRDAARAAHALGIFLDALRSRADQGGWDEDAVRRAHAALEAHETLRENVDAAVHYLRGVVGSSGVRVPSETRLRVATSGGEAVVEEESVEQEEEREGEGGERARRSKRLRR